MKHPHPGRLRDALLDATEGAVDRGGVQGVRLADIAREVGCAISSLYAHFKDRDDMVAAAMARAFCRQANSDIEALKALLDAFAKGEVDAATTLSAVLVLPSDPERASRRWKRLRILALVQTNPATLAQVRGAQEELNVQLQDIVRLGQRAGLVDTEVCPKAFALILQAMPTVLVLNDIVEDTRVGDPEWIVTVQRVMRAFAAPAAAAASSARKSDAA